jgi:threonine aldolase
VEVLHPPEANAVFARLPAAAATTLRASGWRFYEFIAGGGCRFMCAWDTPESAVDAFAADISRACAAAFGGR